MAGLTVAVTGTSSFFGKALLLALESDPEVQATLALDTRAPDSDLRKATFTRLDLIHPRSAEQLAELLRANHVDVLVHTAFLSRPMHRGGWAHELEAIGTRHVLAATESSGVRKLVLRSSTLAYGALPTNPNYLDETTVLQGALQSAFIADKVEAENQTTRFAQKHPDRVVTILRYAPILGHTADTVATLYLRRRVCPTLLGFDPLVQVVHEEDAIEAARCAVHRDVRGAVNIGAPGVLPLTDAIRLAGARPLPTPAMLLRPLSETLWTAQVGEFPPGLLAFLKFVCVGDLRRMHDLLQFTPKFGVRESILSFAGSTRLGRALA